MGKKKYTSAKVVLRSFASSRHSNYVPHSNLMVAIGIGLFILGWFLISYPDWIINRILNAVDLFFK